MGKSLETLILDNKESLTDVQVKINYKFKDIKLLQTSLIHSSFAFERLKNNEHNETLEFLGDAVLDLAVGDMLFKRFPEMREGKLTRIRSALVNESGLATMARNLDLGKYLLLGKGEESSNGREKPSILSCAYEALVGALYLDGGYERAQIFINHSFGPLLESEREVLLATDAKSSLQELLQERYNEGPIYILNKEEGPAHARIFTVSASFRDKILGTGTAPNKKEAEQRAARDALNNPSEILTK
ncbi:MAG: ribonuclease III [Desulfobulbaceae bacterium]|nr:ribonuclease III [Desulfobulbaceae bacterium]